MKKVLSAILVTVMFLNIITVTATKGGDDCCGRDADCPSISGYITVRGEKFYTSLTKWDFSNLGLNDTDILDLRYMVTIFGALLNNNQISDLTPLSGLITLFQLYLHENQISDITPLAGLINLEHLRLHENQINDITPLSGLTKLTELRLDGNPISDITPLAGLTSLRELNLDNTQISDLAPLAGLTNLKNLYLRDNPITLSQVNELQEALPNTVIHHNAPADCGCGRGEGCTGDITVKGAKYDTSLTVLYLFRLGLTNADIVDLKYMVNLERLQSHDNHFTDLTPLSGLTNLGELMLINHYELSDISPLAGLTDLGALWIRRSQVSDVTPLSGLTNLTTLILSGNQISDLTPISGLTSLVSLWLDCNPISDITVLSGLTDLLHLDLSFNEISDLTPLSGLMSLEELDLRHNQITDLTPLSGLTNLKWVRLQDNPITLSQVKALQEKLPRTFIAHNAVDECGCGRESACPDVTGYITIKGVRYVLYLTGLHNLHESELTNADIADLKYMADLTAINLSDNKISDLTPFSGLTKLTSLDLSGNPISDLTPLAGLTNLQFLHLHNTPVTLSQVNALKTALPSVFIFHNVGEGCSCGRATICPVVCKWHGTRSCMSVCSCDALPCESGCACVNCSFVSTVTTTPCTTSEPVVTSAPEPPVQPYRVACECDCGDSPTLGKSGHILGNAAVTTADALEILKYIVKLPTPITTCNNARKAATIMGSSITTADALEILKHIVKLPNKIDGNA